MQRSSSLRQTASGRTSGADTFPTTVLEALACGAPVVASAVGGIPEQVVEGRTGFLVPVGEARAMAERVLDLLADEGLRLRMGRQAAEDAAWRFGLERMVGSILRFTGRTTKAKAYRLKRATL